MGNRLADLVGPFYDTEGASTLLGISEQAVAELRDSGDLLGMQTSDDDWVYPTFQFTGHQVNPALLPALRVLHGQPARSIGVWFVAPDENLNNLSPSNGPRPETRRMPWSRPLAEPQPGGRDSSGRKAATAHHRTHPRPR
ncbi:hypothetical protein [Nocardioides sp. B-3]|uniref:hypothetical protein n=1 Tax=Nocardioides sp. B-3 TaxID=2895565 RepID=UPI002152ABB7|nr:hypothetical protein [Nocardioides sp. B-3]UUZ60578.1 hypothetical protein LP418_06835 [Nocardioides sp. B-3]